MYDPLVIVDAQGNIILPLVDERVIVDLLSSYLITVRLEKEDVT